jgi:hypothetical protein
MAKVDIFHFVAAIKKKLTPESLVGDEGSISRPLLPFVREVMNMEYDSAPNYLNLRFLLISCLVKQGDTFNLVYDWNKHFNQKAPTEDQFRTLKKG